MRKTVFSVPKTRIRARYSKIGPIAASKTKKPPDESESAEVDALTKRRLPVRIKVLAVNVPIGNPYDIGIEETLKALRRSGVLTKAGKLGKIFR